MYFHTLTKVSNIDVSTIIFQWKYVFDIILLLGFSTRFGIGQLPRDYHFCTWISSTLLFHEKCENVSIFSDLQRTKMLTHNQNFGMLSRVVISVKQKEQGNSSGSHKSIVILYPVEKLIHRIERLHGWAFCYFRFYLESMCKSHYSIIICAGKILFIFV